MMEICVIYEIEARLKTIRRREDVEQQLRIRDRLSVRNQNSLYRTERTALETVLAALGSDAGGRTGIVLRILFALDTTQGPKGWRQMYYYRVGYQTEEDTGWDGYDTHSMEKFTRLAAHHHHDGHISSWETRDERWWSYGGAFILSGVTVFGPEAELLGPGNKVMLSASGLPEIGDEAFCLLVAREMSWGDMEAYNAVTQHSGNTLALELLAG